MRVIIGYFLLAFSVVLFLSLLSFDPADSAWLVSSVNRPPENIAGVFGVLISTPVIILYGRWSALLLNFGLFVVGINLVIRAKIGRVLIKAVLFFIASISLTVILSALIKDVSFMDAGIIGISIGRSLTELIHPFVVAGLFALIFVLALSSTMKLFQKLTFGVARVLGLVVLAPFELFGLIVNKDRRRGEEQPEKEVFADKEQEAMFRESSGMVPSEGESDLADENGFDQAPEDGEPDFLKTDRGLVSSDEELTPRKENGKGAGDRTSAGPAADMPSWLTASNEKEQVLDRIRHRFDDEIGVSPVETREIPEHEDMRNIPKVPDTTKKAVHEPPQRIPEEPVMREQPQQILPETSPIVEIAADELDEIAGEADYKQETKKRKSKQPVQSEEEDQISGYADEEREYIYPGSTALEKNFDEISRTKENQEIERVSRIIENTFSSFKIDIKVSGYSRGPAITRYEMVPPIGLKLKNIVNLSDDLSLNLGTKHIRIVYPIGEQRIVGVEVPNQQRRNVVLREIIDSEEFKESKAKLPLILGKDIAGNIVIEDLTDMPHLLIAGTTGSGKSVYVNSLIGGIVFTRSSDEVKFIFIDPKMVELELYNGIPHLLTPVITAPEEAIAVLQWASAEVDRRYKALSEYSVRNIIDYNKEIKKINAVRRRNKEALMEHFPYIVIVIDEFANLMLRLPKETEKVISKIAAMARAVGIHLVVATQRPSVDVVTGIIKANFPSRIAFRVASLTDSRTILDKSGAERLLGKGDMLFMTPNFTDMIRIQAPFVSNKDVDSLVRELKRNGTADYKLNIEELMSPESGGVNSDYDTDYRQDPIFTDSLRAAVENGEVSASYLQRRFRIGYNRASRIMDAMERMNILGPSTGSSKPREVLIGEEELQNLLQRPSE